MLKPSTQMTSVKYLLSLTSHFYDPTNETPYLLIVNKLNFKLGYSKTKFYIGKKWHGVTPQLKKNEPNCEPLIPSPLIVIFRLIWS